MKKTVNAFDYAGDICKAMKKGILVTAKCGDQINPMTIGWGSIGIEWGKQIFIAFIRPCRYTQIWVLRELMFMQATSMWARRVL